MNYKTFKKIKLLVVAFVSINVSLAVSWSNAVWAIVSIFVGILFLSLFRKMTKEVIVDERTIDIGNKASNFAYTVTTSVLAITSLLLMIAGERYTYLQTLGITFSYLVLFIVGTYSLAFYYLNKKMG